jgi:phosphatidate cytidylyltransferase
MFGFSTTVLQQTLVANFALLLSATCAVEVFKSYWNRHTYVELVRRIRTWWVILTIFGIALLIGRGTFLAFIALVSFLALREYISLIPTRQADRSMILLAYAFIPLHYGLIALELTGTYTLIAPIFAFFIFQCCMVFRGVPDDFLASAASLFWGLLTCIICVSYVAALRVVPPEPTGAGLVFFLVFLTEFNDIAQYIWGRMIGKRKIAPLLSPGKTWGGLIGGCATTTVSAAGLGPYLTEFSILQSILAGLLIGIIGFIGDLNISALKRSLHIKDSGQLLPGHGGVLDRVDSLIFTAPALFFFHSWLSSAGHLP